MYNGLLYLHSVARWAILILLVIALYRHFTGMNKRSLYNSADKKLDLVLMITVHITLLFGLFQWFTGPLGLKLIQQSGFGEVMKDKAQRYWAVEHLAGMLIAITLITIGRGKGKGQGAGAAEHRKAFTLYLIALVILLVSIPWPFREAIGRPWFPGVQ